MIRSLTVKFLLIVFCLATALSGQAQERGKFKSNPRITPKSTTNPNFPVAETPKKADEFEQESTQLRFNNQFEPKKELSPVVAEDTTHIDQGETNVVEVVDSVQVGNEWVQIASYYTIWDSHTIDPYDINPLNFDEVIDIKLYDPPANRYWSAPMNEGKMTSNFGFRWGRWHTGTDLDCETGDPIYSAFDGIVRVVAWDGNGYGRYVVIRHYNGLDRKSVV